MIEQIQKATAFSKRKLLVEIRKLEAVIKADPFAGLAAELQDVLLHGWNAATKEAINEVIRKLSPSVGAQLNLFTDADLNKMLPELRLILGDKFAGDISASVKEIILNTYSAGLTGSATLKPTFNIVDTQAIRFLQEHNVYWVKHYFDNNLQNKVTEFGTQIIEQGLSRAEAGKLFETAFAKQFETYSWRYWQGFANHVVTRSREFGNVERYVKAEIEYLQVKAVLDQRTTEICRHMHNRVISVGKSVELRNQLIAAKTPEEVKEISPWMKPETMAGKSSARLMPGMSLPPYHFNCRSRTVRASNTAIQEQKGYEKNVNRLHKNNAYKKHYEEYRALGEEAPVVRTLRYDENVVAWMQSKGYGPNLDTAMNKYKEAYSAVLDKAKANTPKKKN